MDSALYLGAVPPARPVTAAHLSDTICFRRQLIFFTDSDPDVGVRAGITPTWRVFSAVNRLTAFGLSSSNAVWHWLVPVSVRLSVCRAVGRSVSQSVSQSPKPHKLQVAGVLISSARGGGH